MTPNERVSVGLLVSTPAVCSELQASLRRLPAQIVIEERASRPDSTFFSRLQSLHPELVLVEQPADRSLIQTVLGAVAQASPSSTLVLVNQSADSEAILEAVRAGARDYLYVPFGDTLAGVIARLQGGRQQARRGASRPEGRVIGFLSAKGGCGASTVAVHLAVSLARESGTATGLADFDLTCGQVSFLTNARNRHTVVDAAASASRLDDSFWSALVTECSGIEVLAAPAPLAVKAYPEAEQFCAVLDFMRSRYAWSVVDLGRGMHAFPASLVGHIDEIYLVTTPERTALALAKRVADSLRHGLDFGGVRLIVNRSPAAAVPEIERLTGLEVCATLVCAETDLNEALEEGRLVSEKAQISRQFAILARRVAGLERQEAEQVSGLATGVRKLFGRLRQTGQGRPSEVARPAAVWEVLSRDAETAFRSGRYGLAANYLAQAVEEARSLGAGDASLGRLLGRLGVAQCRQGRYAEAQRSLKTAARILEQALGAADASLLEVLTNLAAVFKDTQQHESARQLYESVLKTAESALGPDHTMVAWILDGLGDVRLAQKEPTAALYAYRRALSIKEQTLGPNDWEVAVTLDKMSVFYSVLGRRDDAEPLLWRSIEIRAAVVGQGSPTLAKHYISLGTLNAAQRRYPEAERLLRYGITIAPADGPQDELAPALYKLAEACEGQARFGEAESIRAVAHQITSAETDSVQILAREFSPSAAVVPSAPRGFRTAWAQTSF